MRIWLKKHPVTHRFAWTGLIIIVYLLGKTVPLPFKSVIKDVEANQVLNLTTVFTGGNASSLTLFSLGIGPWMSSMIIFDFLQRAKLLGIDKLPKRRRDFRQNCLTLIIALIQAYVTVATMDLRPDTWLTELEVVVILTAGAFFVAWLTNLNAKNGIGGMMVIMIVGMLQSNIATVFSNAILQHRSATFWTILWVCVAIVFVLFVYISVVFEHAERRLPVEHILIDSRYAKKSYLPFKLSPAGGMPIMYAMSLYSLPLYLMMLLQHFWPTNKTLTWISTNYTLTKPLGVIVYVVMIIILAYLFSFMMIDAEQQAEDLQKAGDYLPGYAPGEETEKRIKQMTSYFSFIGAVYLFIVAGIPVLFGVGSAARAQLAQLPGTIFMIVGFAITIIEQVKTLRIRDQYTSLL